MGRKVFLGIFQIRRVETCWDISQLFLKTKLFFGFFGKRKGGSVVYPIKKCGNSGKKW
jgi:hypothetical protein